MREILFRGKRIDNGEWAYGYYLADKLGSYISGKHYKIIPETVGEYLGIPDKNKKKLFEGDIVKVKDYIDLYEVIYEPLWMQFVLKQRWHNVEYVMLGGQDDDSVWYDEIEIVGNITDNPELLESK